MTSLKNKKVSFRFWLPVRFNTVAGRVTYNVSGLAEGGFFSTKVQSKHFSPAFGKPLYIADLLLTFFGLP